jgi:hypothetical protein
MKYFKTSLQISAYSLYWISCKVYISPNAYKSSHCKLCTENNRTYSRVGQIIQNTCNFVKEYY